MSPDRVCAIVPTHNHVAALPAILERLTALGLPVIVIDDGSAPARGAEIAAAGAQFDEVECLRHSYNGGKGFAVLCGLARAAERGFVRALQVDADGQHDLDAVPALLQLAADNPGALVTGEPRYDDTVPMARRFGRKLTGFWVAVNALSLTMPDAMCGFRVYPVAETLSLVNERAVRSRRMEFDIEVLIGAKRAGMPVIGMPVRVTYPEGNHSNFALLRDNVLLGIMQTRLVFGLPGYLWRRLAAQFRPSRPQAVAGEPEHWAEIQERGTYLGLRLLAFVYRVFGRRICRAFLAPVVLFFFLTGTGERRASRDFLERAWRRGYLTAPPTWRTGLKHFMTFADSALDKFAAWTGAAEPADIGGIDDGLFAQAKRDGGAFVITAHYGNPEVIRAIASLSGRWRVNVLVHTVHAEMFNRMIRRFSPDAPVRMIQVTAIGPETAIELAAAVGRGEWVVMVGDRVPVGRGGRAVPAPFMGAPAPFPQGPYILGSLLGCPSYLMYCRRVGAHHEVDFAPFADPIELPRGRRQAALAAYAERYAQALESQVAKDPLQWFNFYDFWHGEEDSPAEASSLEAAA